MRYNQIMMAGVLLIVGLIFAQPSWSAESLPDSLSSDRRVRSAVLRSLVLPGWGQFYNGKHIKGSVIAAAGLASSVAYVVQRNQINDPDVHTRNIYFFTTIGVVLYSMADAYVDAHLAQVNWAEVEAGVDEKGGAKLRLKFKF